MSRILRQEDTMKDDEIQITAVVPGSKIAFTRTDGKGVKTENVWIEIDEQPSPIFTSAIESLVNPVCDLGWLGDGWTGDIIVKKVAFKWAETEFSAVTSIAKVVPREPMQPFTLRKISADRLNQPDHSAYLSALENVIAAAADYVRGVRAS